MMREREGESHDLVLVVCVAWQILIMDIGASLSLLGASSLLSHTHSRSSSSRTYPTSIIIILRIVSIIILSNTRAQSVLVIIVAFIDRNRID